MDRDGRYWRIPEATVSRLPVYLRTLLGLSEQGVETISSERLAGVTALNAAKVRKDLSYLGSHGTRGVGYDVLSLVDQISSTLGLDRGLRVGIAGAGNLGRALANYAGFSERGFVIDALFDSDPAKIGTRIGSVDVDPTDEIPSVVAARGIDVGIIATPADAAQRVAEAFVGGGVLGILNFAPAVLDLPPGIVIRKVDLSIELQILAFYVGREAGLRPDEPRDGPRDVASS